MLIKPNHAILTSESDVQAICAPIKKLGINHFSFSRMYPNGKRIYLGTCSAWLEHYFKKDFFRTGACEKHPRIYKPQMRLWSSLPNQQMYQAASEFDLREGIFIVNPQQSFTEFFDFSTTEPNLNIINIYLNNQDLLNTFITYFIDKADFLIKKIYKYNFTLPFHNENYNFIEEENNCNFLFNRKINLSARQKECILLSAQGKTHKQIAQTLSLSPRMIETYMNNLRIKYRVDTTIELILKIYPQILREETAEKNLTRLLGASESAS